jgi:hypothetical protein
VPSSALVLGVIVLAVGSRLVDNRYLVGMLRDQRGQERT